MAIVEIQQVETKNENKNCKYFINLEIKVEVLIIKYRAKCNVT